MGGSDLEELQGKALIEESLKNNVSHFVYSSVDRNGEKSYDNPTPIPHFISKHNIEHHLHEQTDGGEKMSFTVLRPVAFFDNLANGFIGKAFSSAWKVAVKERPLQLIAVSDIGWFAAQAFISADKPEYKNQSIALAGDSLAWADAAKVFKGKVGKEMPTTWDAVAKGFMWAAWSEFGVMMYWFYDEGYGADIEGLRKLKPDLLDFGSWLEKDSQFKDQIRK